jgi:hypothetical protein
MATLNHAVACGVVCTNVHQGYLQAPQQLDKVALKLTASVCRYLADAAKSRYNLAQEES